MGASALLIAMPGPNAALIVARTLSHGRGAGLATLVGTWSGAAIQLGVVVAGLAALAVALSDIMQWVRWIGMKRIDINSLDNFNPKLDDTV